MLKFAANISTMFVEFDFLERYAAASKAGFRMIECQYPYEFPPDLHQEYLEVHQLELLLLNSPPGTFKGGKRGMACLPGREIEFRESIHHALHYASVLHCSKVHVIAGICSSEFPLEKQEEVFIENIQYAAKEAAKQNCLILIEPINNIDTPGYFLNTPLQAGTFLEKINEPNCRMQFDVYHCQKMVGQLEYHIRRYFPVIDHIQISALPNRSEPDQGEINFPYIFSLLEELDYQGWIGCEYTPRGDTFAGLGWLKNL
ncbi:MAG: TIM barrel protein [SAR324 cluster bacterium]|nr:TIM barrel protein [SAR324 cluster bacterium]